MGKRTVSRALGPRAVHSLGLVALVLLGGGATSGCSSDEDDGDDAAAEAGEGGSGGSSQSGTGPGGTNSKAGSTGASGSNGSGGKGGSSSSGAGTDNGGTDSGDAGAGDDGGSAGSGTSGSSSGKAGSAGQSSGSGSAHEAAEKMGREPNFLIGMGNDLNNDHNQDGAYTLGVTLDLHYAYLVGLPGEGGWPDWNPNGSFVNILADTAHAHGVTPMYDIYTMASRGEANLNPLNDAVFMQKYWDTLKLLYARLAEFDEPAVVHFEPDFWAFAQQQSGGDPANVPTKVGSVAEECAGQPENMVGLGYCMLELGRMYAPKVLLGFHASRWAGSVEGIVSFLNAVGAGESDFIGMDMLDRDAGCFEEQAEGCTRQDGPWYWDETNQTSPNFHEYIDWSKQVGDGLGVPPLWWQIPFGVPSDEPGGTPEHYRDNRVRYIFSHIDEFVAAGGLGAVFGVGSGGQTYITTDGGQFQNAVTGYFADPVPLP